MKHVIGIDIGGTSTTLALTSEQGVIEAKEVVVIKDYASQPIESFLDALIESIQRLTQHYEIVGVGIGAPNGNYYNGTIEYAPNMQWRDVHPVAGYLQERLGCKVILTNDANAAAIGEMEFGVAKEMKDFILITLGTGLGSGLVAGGQVIYGHDGFAGELGHSVVVPGGRECTCGRKGCLEAYVSIRGVMQTYKELGGKEASSPNEVAVLAENGDAISIETYKKTGEWLGLKLADAATYTSPEAIIFFGGIAEAHELFFPSLKEMLESNVHNLYRNKIKILRSGLPMNEAALLGAAALVL